jgi:hypothetical protein
MEALRSDAAYKKLTIEVLGKIAVRLQKEKMDLQTLTRASEAHAAELRTRCVCGERALRQHSTMVCRGCERVCHVACVPCDPPSAAEKWLCADCTELPLGSTAGELLLRADQLRVMHLDHNMVLAYLLRTEPTADAAAFCAGQWLSEPFPDTVDKALEDAANEQRARRLLSGVAAGELAFVLPPADESQGGRSEALAFARSLGFNSRLAQNMDAVLQHVLAALNDQDSAARCRSLHALAAIVAINPDILHDARIKTSVENRCRDKQTSVREAAVELLGNYVLTRPSLVQEYHATLLERLKASEEKKERKKQKERKKRR